MRRLGVFLLLIVSTLWAVAIVAAPHAGELAERRPASRHTLAAATTFVYVTGSVICHQRPERSFFAAGYQYPVCARCTGLYVSAPIGILAIVLAPRRATRARGSGSSGNGSRVFRRWRWVLSLAAVPTVVSIVVERAGGPSDLTSRALAALPLGAALAACVTAAILGHFAPSLAADGGRVGERRAGV